MDNTPELYDKQTSIDNAMKEKDEISKTHDSGENPIITEKVYISDCGECGQFLGMECEALSWEEREKYKCGYKTIKYKGKILCPHCLTKQLWQDGLKEIGGIKMDAKEMAVKEPIVMPAVSAEKALEVWNAYLELKKKVAEPSDIQKIQGKDFLKKSYWRKIATFFNLSVEIVDEKTETIHQCGQDVLVYHFRARAIHNNGRYAEGTGSCDIYDHATIKDGKFMVYDKYKKGYKEAEPKSIHTTRTTAETRAWNRAVSNLVGGGEVSAEEIKEDVEAENGHSVKTEEKLQQEKQPTISLTIGQALQAKEGAIVNIMGRIQNAEERKTKKGTDITDYRISSSDDEKHMTVMKWGKCHEGLKQGQTVIFKDVKVASFYNNLTYTAQEIEIL